MEYKHLVSGHCGKNEPQRKTERNKNQKQK